MNDTASDLIDCLVAKAEYETGEEGVPQWLSVKILDLCERLAYCD